MDNERARLAACLAAVREKTDFVPRVALVLGSGLGGFADRIRREAVVDYRDVPGFPVSTAPGHAGRFVFGWVEATPVVCMQGRIHMYEGYSARDAALPVRLMRGLGAEIFFVTNACGGIRPDLTAGTLMLLTDQISCFVPNPLQGENLSELGVRFPDMTEVFDRGLRSIVRGAAERSGVELKEGVYVQLPGPSFETPAEIRMLGALGADAVGMSTVVETIAARHAGMRSVGVSCVANLAAGLSPTPLTGEEVIEIAGRTAPRFQTLLWESIADMKGDGI